MKTPNRLCGLLPWLLAGLAVSGYGSVGPARHILPPWLPVLLLLSLPLAVQSQDYTWETNRGAITITKYTGPGGDVTIPNTVFGLPVTRIGDNAFQFCMSLTRVIIGTNVAGIGDQAFYCCRSLTNVTIPAGATSIGDRAFSGCNSLGSITVDPLNSNYNSVDGVLFNKSQTTLITCPGAKVGGYTIPISVTTIGGYAFSDCGLASVTIPASVTSIADHAFENCGGLRSLTIPTSVTRIGDRAFLHCWQLPRITIPNRVTSIGEGTFQDCNGLTNVTLPESVTSVGTAAFYGCARLAGLTIPNRITSIGDHAFENCDSLASLTLPDSLTNIGSAAFYRCTRLSTVTIPDRVTRIPDSAFGSCASLTNVMIGKGVTRIDWTAFTECTGLMAIGVSAANSVYDSLDGVLFNKNRTTLVACPGAKAGDYTIPGTITSIGPGAFAHCINLTSVTLHASATNIGYLAFASCTRLAGITVDPLNPVYSSVAGVLLDKSQTLLVAYPAGKPGSLTLPASVAGIGYGALEGCASIRARPGSAAALAQATNTPPVDPATLDAFMEKWKTGRSFQIPMEASDRPLILAALAKDPKGPWAYYFYMQCGETRFQLRNAQGGDRKAVARGFLPALRQADTLMAKALAAAGSDENLRGYHRSIQYELAFLSLEAGEDLGEVRVMAQTQLDQAKTTNDWNYGNVIYRANELLGRLALRQGNPEEARAYLRAAGRTPGSPQLDSYGPDFHLARELLQHGAQEDREAVIAFLDDVAKFWANLDNMPSRAYGDSALKKRSQLEAWQEQIRAGKIPNNVPNWR